MAEIPSDHPDFLDDMKLVRPLDRLARIGHFIGDRLYPAGYVPYEHPLDEPVEPVTDWPSADEADRRALESMFRKRYCPQVDGSDLGENVVLGDQ